MNQTYTKAEAAHVDAVRHLPCSVCNEPPPSQAHHCEQDCAWTVIALCEPCHQGPKGWHGTRERWKMRKLFDEIGALGVTLTRLLGRKK